MNDKKHPSLSLLKQYAENPDMQGMEDLSLHLLSCQDCRKEIEVLQLIPDPDLFKSSPLDESLQQSIMDYIDNRLADKYRLLMEEELQNNPIALKFALHYACSSSAMQRDLASDLDIKASEAKKENKKSMGFLSSIFQFRIPVWLFVPMSVSAAVLFAWLIIPLIQVSSDYQLITYQDNQEISFKNKNNVPGMGFFKAAKITSYIYDQVNVQLLKDNQLKISWPRVKNSNSYSIDLAVFDKGQRRSLGRISTNKLFAIFDTQSIDLKRRYEWTLTGEAKNNQQFSAKGGFLIH